MTSVAVIGIGNILLGDDGAGVRAIAALEKAELPPTVKLVDGGTSVIDMLGYFLDHSSVFVIDALRAGLEPGTIYRITPGQIVDYKRENLSLHDVQILDVVKMANMLGSFPDVVIYAIEPEIITYGLELSEKVASKLTELARLVKTEIETIC